MKKTMRKMYMCLLMIAMVVTVVMCFAACGKKDVDSAPIAGATNSPENKVFTLQLEGSDNPEAGTEVTYKVLVKDVKTKDNIIGLDFFLTYNTDLFTYKDSEITKAPTDDWWLTDYNDEEKGKIEYHSCGEVEKAVITGDDQYTISVTFEVKENAETDEDWLVKIVTDDNVTGTDFSESINSIYGTGSEIKKAR